MSNIHFNRSGNFLLVPKVTKNKSGPKVTQQARVSKQHTELRKKSIHEDKKIPQKTNNYHSYKPTPIFSPEKCKLASNIIVVPAPPTTSSFNQDHNRTQNHTPYKNPFPHPLLKPYQPYNQGYGQGYSGNEGKLVPQSKPVCTESRVMMINKACHVLPELHDATQYTNTSPNEVYQALLIEQYGFDPIENITSAILQPIEKSFNKCPNPTVENSSQCENPATTNTGTNGTNIQMAYSFADHVNSFIPKNIEISNSPRLKVIAEKFMRFKKDHIEIRQLEERIICVEYDVFCRDDLVKKPAQVMRAYFCVKTGCEECKGALLNNLYVQYNVPLGDKTLKNRLETELEIIDEKLPENKPYLKDLQTVLKKRQAMNTKKQQSTLDLMSMYTMAFNEMSPRDHDWSHTNLLSKAELDEVKHLILKKCESRVHNLSRKKFKVNDKLAKESTNTVGTEKSDSLCYNLLRGLDKQLKAT